VRHTEQIFDSGSEFEPRHWFNIQWPLENGTIGPSKAGLNHLEQSGPAYAALIAGVGESRETQQRVRDMKESLKAAGVPCGGDALERMLLSHAIEQSIGK